jgi:GNAT superfamily N-acetyltransferase
MPDQPEVPGLLIHPATPDDVPVMLELIRELAGYEKEPDAVKTTPQQLHDALFGERPAAEAVIARLDGQPAGWALWFQSYSTWTGLPGLWLEDLFVRPTFRRRGIGRALLAHLAQVCVDRGYGRLEWSVLDWNSLALDFYRGLGSEAMFEWTTHRLTGDALRRLALEAG